MALIVPAKPLVLFSLRSLSRFFPYAVILQECVVSEDHTLAFLKGPKTARDARRLALHPVLQVLFYHLLNDACVCWGLKRAIVVRKKIKRHGKQ